MTARRSLQDLVFIGIVSAAVLAYELQLTRILSVHYWSYYASMIVSLAMLGFAASGTALFLLARRKRGAAPLLPGMTLCFAVALPVCPPIAEAIPSLPLVVLWDPQQLLLFAADYLVLSLPFFFGGFLIGHFFTAGGLRPGRVYFANMFGSGLGITAALTLLCRVRPPVALALIVVPVIAVLLPRLKRQRRRAVFVAAALAAAVVPAVRGPSRPAMSEYKGMSKLLRMPDAEVEVEAWGPYGYVALADSETIRYAPGLTLAFAGRIPDQKAVFVNGDNMEAVCATGDEPALRTWFGAMLGGLAYRFHDRPRVLAAGAGGGMDVLAGLVQGAARVDALENNADVAALMTGPLAGFSGNLYRRSRVRLFEENARAYLQRATNRYDLVLVPARRSLFASAAGTSSQDPDYVLTREALRDSFSVLAPGGVIAMETWINLPPRHSARLFATAAAALREAGLPPGDHLAAARSLRTALLLVFRDPVTPAQADRIRSFCADRSFDLVHVPGIAADEANRFNRVAGAPYFSIARDILNEPEAVYRRHLYRLEPPTDDRPYFSHFFKWAAFPQLLDKTGRNVAVHIGWGYMFLLITLTQAIPLGALLILAPLFLSQREQSATYRHRARAYLYFAALGCGFMLIELAAIQQFARFLPHPVYAFGITIGIVLLCSGLGALVSARRAIPHRAVFGAILAGALLHLALWRLSIHGRSVAAFRLDIAVVAALSFFMGMPFPRGIERLRAAAPDLVPWAWGINGFLSVLAVLAAGLVSLAWGLSALVLLGAAAYGLAALTFPPAKAPERGADPAA